MQIYLDIFLQLLSNIATVAALAMAGFVTLSYLFFWYELANRRRQIVKLRFKLTRLGAAVSLLVGEFSANLVSWLFYPLGWLPFSTACFEKNPRQTVVLLHGLYQNRACCYWLQLRLAVHGYRVVTINLPPWKDLESLTEKLDQTLARLRQELAIQQVDIIGHSMGGIIARNYIQRRGGAPYIRSCITLGTPHFGSRLAVFAITSLAQTLIPRSPLLSQLNRSHWPPNVALHSIYSATDNLLLPTRSGQSPLARNYRIGHCGHMLLLYHPHVFNRIHTVLQEVGPP